MSGTVRVLKYFGLAVGYMLPKGQIGVTAATVIVDKAL
jgi:hypothetical protein